MHYYNYDADCEDYTTYPEARFISEHGFQSWPALAVLEGVSSEQDGDWSYESAFFAYRQRHQKGNAELTNMMGKHFKVPPANASSSSSRSSVNSSSIGSMNSSGIVEDVSQRQLFDSYLYLTQVQQARW